MAKLARIISSHKNTSYSLALRGSLRFLKLKEECQKYKEFFFLDSVIKSDHVV
jgi:hypothetical protein